MMYPTKGKLPLVEHPVTNAPGSSEASATKAREENRSFCCDYYKGSIIVAIFYLAKTSGVIGILFYFLCDEGMREHRDNIYGALAVMVTSVIFNLLMLYGAMKRLPAFLSPWLMLENCTIVFIIALMIIYIHAIAVSVGLLALAILRICCASVVWKYRHQLMAQPPKSEGNAQA
ncbi:uncharacterized protein LOC134784611 isoform X2 [Penaeus indicus]